SSSREKRKRSYANKSGCVRKLKRVVEKSSWPKNAQGPRRKSGLTARPRRQKSAGAQRKPLGPTHVAARRKRNSGSKRGCARKRKRVAWKSSWPRNAQKPRRRNERAAKPRRQKSAGAQRKQLGPSSSREKRKRSYANKSGCVRKVKRVVEKSSWPKNAQGPRRKNGLGAKPRKRTSAGAQ